MVHALFVVLHEIFTEWINFIAVFLHLSVVYFFFLYQKKYWFCSFFCCGVRAE